MSELQYEVLVSALARIEATVEEILARTPAVEPGQRDDRYLEELREKYGPEWPGDKR